MTLTFRTAVLDDTENIVTMVNSAYRGDSSKEGWTTEADLLGGQRTDSEKITEMISDPQSQIELALNDGQIVGCIYLKKEDQFVYFGMLTVRPTLQTNGYGKKLLMHLEELAFIWGKKKIKMTVISIRHELIEFYQRRGYRWTGEIEAFPSNDPRFGLPKTDLVFHVFEKMVSEKQ
jgi:GNAT superfamily N-acetyltransferase